jgi:hypothetical protein
MWNNYYSAVIYHIYIIRQSLNVWFLSTVKLATSESQIWSQQGRYLYLSSKKKYIQYNNAYIRMCPLSYFGKRWCEVFIFTLDTHLLRIKYFKLELGTYIKDDIIWQPCHSSGSCSSASHCTDGHSYHRGCFSMNISVSPSNYHFTNCSAFINNPTIDTIGAGMA